MYTKDKTIKYFSDDERKAFFLILEEASKNAVTDFQKKLAYRNEAMFKIMYYCALRATETVMLKTDYYNKLSKEMYCQRIKGGSNNTIKIVDEKKQHILQALNRHIKINQPNGYLFCNINDNLPLSRKTLDCLIKKYCETAHILNKEKCHCHTLRHTRAIDLAENGLDLKDLQYWLGHADVSNTLIYFHFTSRQQQQMYDKLLAQKGKKNYE